MNLNQHEVYGEVLGNFFSSKRCLNRKRLRTLDEGGWSFFFFFSRRPRTAKRSDFKQVGVWSDLILKRRNSSLSRPSSLNISLLLQLLGYILFCMFLDWTCWFACALKEMLKHWFDTLMLWFNVLNTFEFWAFPMWAAFKLSFCYSLLNVTWTFDIVSRWCDHTHWDSSVDV